MKKLISILFGLMLLVSIVVAIPSPHPVLGTITNDDLPIQNLEIQYTNKVTGVSATTITTEDGQYQFELGNIDQDHRTGDLIEISLIYCASLARCTQSTTLGEGYTRLSFNVNDATDIPDDATVVKFVCWDGIGVSDETECPDYEVCPDGITLTYVDDLYRCPKETCEDGTEIYIGEECPTEISAIWGYIIAVLATVLAGLGLGWSKGFMGLCKYYWKKGMAYEKAGDKYNAEKCKRRAIKMAKTAFEKAIANKYENKL